MNEKEIYFYCECWGEPPLAGWPYTGRVVKQFSGLFKGAPENGDVPQDRDSQPLRQLFSTAQQHQA